MRAFLTGGTGFIGKPLTRQLLKRGWQMTALVRNPDSQQARAISETGAMLIKGDVTDKESMREGMTDADITINNAGVYEFGVAGDAIKRMYDIMVAQRDFELTDAHRADLAQVLQAHPTIHSGDFVVPSTWIRE